MVLETDRLAIRPFRQSPAVDNSGESRRVFGLTTISPWNCRPKRTRISAGAA